MFGTLFSGSSAGSPAAFLGDPQGRVPVPQPAQRARRPDRSEPGPGGRQGVVEGVAVGGGAPHHGPPAGAGDDLQAGDGTPGQGRDVVAPGALGYFVEHVASPPAFGFHDHAHREKRGGFNRFRRFAGDVQGALKPAVFQLFGYSVGRLPPDGQ